MAKQLYITTLVFCIATIILYVAQKATSDELLFTLFISFGVTFYHFFMRLIMGAVVSMIFHNRVDYKKRWFQPIYFEKKFYEVLKVKRWKEKMPTFDETQFSLEKHSLEEIVQAMCQAEITHEAIAVCSLLPILLTIKLGTFWVFFITSVLAAVFDMSFVAIQRYNRPRILRMILLQRNRVS